jgi:hypothetical protein
LDKAFKKDHESNLKNFYLWDSFFICWKKYLPIKIVKSI